MLVKAFNRLPMTEGFGGKNESDKKKKNKKKTSIKHRHTL